MKNLETAILFGLIAGWSLAPTSPSDAQGIANDVDALVRELGDESWSVREAATRRLAGLGPAVLPVLLRNQRDPDPEIRARIRAILARIRRDSFPLEGFFLPDRRAPRPDV